jgi:SAM-dependent methyltransferase
MKVQQAIDVVAREFPFKGYVDPSNPFFATVATTVQKYMPRGGQILDFGAGACEKVAILQKLGYECAATDDLQDWWHTRDGNREKILRFAQASGIEFRLADGNGLPFADRRFDMVMLLDVLEHLHDSPRELLNDLIGLVKPGGYLFVTVPNAVNVRKRLDVLRGRTNYPRYAYFYWSPGRWRGHVREYTKGDLRSLAGFLGLTLCELRGCDEILQNVPARLRTIYLGVTKFLPDLKDSWLLVAKKPDNWTPKRELPKDEADKVLTRFTRYRCGNSD